MLQANCCTTHAKTPVAQCSGEVTGNSMMSAMTNLIQPNIPHPFLGIVFYVQVLSVLPRSSNNNCRLSTCTVLYKAIRMFTTGNSFKLKIMLWEGENGRLELPGGLQFTRALCISW